VLHPQLVEENTLVAAMRRLPIAAVGAVLKQVNAAIYHLQCCNRQSVEIQHKQQ
jgi:hypothetical protein